ncbi:MAG: hypothetical protein KAI71_03300 [Candidatus Pacebacteria bacterium]|nr:hypothetical protein [Candidatus Paceibacterota bacterium]
MKLKNIIIGIFFSVISFAFVGVASAVNWVPLVPIPGIPATGINLSTYLIGIYNFLLSIVGIVAVMMLILGGMRYITSAGNSAAAADAKDIITNAIVGLLLALLTWVFIATINPDALYLKKPGSTFSATPIVGQGAGACFFSFVLPNVCTCGDGAVIVSSNVNDCVSDCRAQDHCVISPGACIASGANNFGEVDYDGKCHCIDGVDVAPDPVWLALPPLDAELNCDYVCTTPAAATDPIDPADPDYHGINWDIRVGNDLGNLSSGETFTVDGSSPVFFDLSRVRDCRGRTVHLAIDFDGGPNVLALIDNFCCLIDNPGCGATWGWVCNSTNNLITGTAYMCDHEHHLSEDCNVPTLHIPPIPPPIGPPLPIHIYPPSPTDDSYPIYKHVYPNGVVENLWIGISYLDAGVCIDHPNKVFIVTSSN